MTTIAMVAGMLPAAFATGEGGEFRAPMAIAVIGGLIVSTVLSLIFIPSFYTIMDDLGRGTGWLFRVVAHPNERDEEERREHRLDAEIEAAMDAAGDIDTATPPAESAPIQPPAVVAMGPRLVVTDPQAQRPRDRGAEPPARRGVGWGPAPSSGPCGPPSPRGGEGMKSEVIKAPSFKPRICLLPAGEKVPRRGG